MKIQNDKKFCPICAAKQIIGKVQLNQGSTRSYDNGAALTPPMGWSSWNLFRHRINEDLIKEMIEAMDKSGLKDVGYTYVNIDDCWQASKRDEKGRLQWDKVNFPGGIKSLVSYANDRGIKLGIYSSNGTYTCEDYPASLRNERIDAETVAEWGVEYFKYDFCHNVPIPSIAPRIIAVSLAKEDGKIIAHFNSDEVSLKGLARIVKDEKVLTGHYIDGLSADSGSVCVNLTAPAAGKYILHIDVAKDSKKEKFLMILVNGKDEYHTYYMSRNKWTPEGKLQTEIYLNEGENIIELKNPIASRMDSAAVQYKLMGRELKRATKLQAEKNGEKENPIVYSICEWGLNRPWKWGMEAGNLWRTTPDIKANWLSIMGIYEHTVRLYKYSAPGAWNDPDMLEVGNGNLTYEENKAHFSLWCMLSAPLILGNDIRKFILPDGSVDKENKIYKILTNKTMISIDQDILGTQCRRIKGGLIDVLVKPLKGAKLAVCVLNKSGKTDSEKIDLTKLTNLSFANLPRKDSYKVYDVWEDKYIEGSTVICALAEKHGVKVYIVE